MIMDVVQRFASALDAEDYAVAAALLADNCVYTCREEEYHGPLAIIQSYRGNGQSAAKTFERVKYESAVTPLTATTAMIRFTDYLEHRGRQHIFECEQLVEIDDGPSIVLIDHRDLPGQRAALMKFKREIGL